MHVLMLSDFESSGGANIGTARLARAMASVGARVTRLVVYPEHGSPDWRTRAVLDPVLRAAWRQSTRLFRHTPVAMARAAERVVLRPRLRAALRALRPDAISVNNLHGAAMWPDIVGECCAVAPTAWTLRDMWSFTGRCGFAYDCEKFVSGCDSSCPTPHEYPALRPADIASAWRLRRDFFADFPGLAAICPSRWLAALAARGLWRGHRVEVIPNALPLDAYAPIDRQEARAKLGIEASAPVLLTSAPNLADRRKGAHLLVKALEQVNCRPLTVLTMGLGQLASEMDGVHFIPLGYVHGDEHKSLAYSAADILVHAAAADNLPHTVMEALACGTPVAGFAIGGLTDMVEPGETGWLAPEVSSTALASTLSMALGDIGSVGVDYRPRCRAKAEADYSLKVQGERYLQLFRSIGSCRW